LAAVNDESLPLVEATDGIVSPKKLVSGDDVLARQMKDPAFRADREATSLARAVTIEVVKHRAEHGLSQSAFAKRLGAGGGARTPISGIRPGPAQSWKVPSTRGFDQNGDRRSGPDSGHPKRSVTIL
jgi:hypothetical protein